MRQGYIFTGVCQSFCSHGGRVSQHVLGQTPPSWVDTPQTDTPFPPGRHPPDRHPLPAGRHPQADNPLKQTPPSGHCCGRYASYWNAYLLFNRNTQVSQFKQPVDHRRFHTMVSLPFIQNLNSNFNYILTLVFCRRRFSCKGLLICVLVKSALFGRITFCPQQHSVQKGYDSQII